MAIEIMPYIAFKLKTIFIFLLVYLYLINKAIEFNICQSLYKSISNYLISWNIKKLDLFYF